MTPDKVIEVLKKIGINISRKTLYNYEKWGIVSKPVFRNSRSTEYLNRVVMEAFAAWKLLHGDYGNEQFKNFFNNKPPKLSPQAIYAIANTGIMMSVRVSLSELLREKGETSTAAILKDIRNNIDQYCSCKNENKISNFEKEVRHNWGWSDDVFIKRSKAVLNVYKDIDLAIEHEKYVYAKFLSYCDIGVSNPLLSAFSDVYEDEYEKAIGLVKAL